MGCGFSMTSIFDENREREGTQGAQNPDADAARVGWGKGILGE